MKNNCYKNAMEHLRFSDDLAERVRNSEKRTKRKFRAIRLLSLAAVLCSLLVITVLAESWWFQRNIDVVDLGTETVDVSKSEILEIHVVHTNDGVDIYCMELPPKNRYVRNGMISDGAGNFHRVTEDYTIEKLEGNTISGSFEKNGLTYRLSVDYVRQNGNIITGSLRKHPVEHGEVLLNASCAPNNNWPVYVNLDTGEIRDALPSFCVDDFGGHVDYVYQFRNGFLVSGISESSGGIERNQLYWVKNRNSEPIAVEMLEEYWTVEDENLYFYNMNRNTRIHYSGSDTESILLEGNFQTGDAPDQGLFTVRQLDGTLAILDVINQNTYSIPEIRVSYQDLDYRRTNASRNSINGKIVLTSISYDRENSFEKMDSIGFLDPASGIIKFLDVESRYGMKSFGWLDDDRYAVIYEDGVRQYLYIYEVK